MASGQLSREEALACSGCRHACHVMLYADTTSKLFGSTPIRHVVLRFAEVAADISDASSANTLKLCQFLQSSRSSVEIHLMGGTLGTDLVNPEEESLEAGLSRELLEELGLEVPITEEDYVETCRAPVLSSKSTSRLILHFYVKKMEEEQIREVEKAAASSAVDHGLEVMGMVRVPLFRTTHNGGLSFFLSHSFIGNARSQLIRSLLRLNLVSPQTLTKALRKSLRMHAETREDLRAALAFAERSSAAGAQP